MFLKRWFEFYRCTADKEEPKSLPTGSPAKTTAAPDQEGIWKYLQHIT